MTKHVLVLIGSTLALLLALAASPAGQRVTPAGALPSFDLLWLRRPGAPVRLMIPTLEIDAPVEHVATATGGVMDVPKEWANVAWYEPGPRPGEDGSAVIAGHFDSFTGPAVFWQLSKLQPGDEVQVTDDRGAVHTFRVLRAQRYTDDDAPLQLIFGKSDHPLLNLITCGGTWDTSKGAYAERLVVFTELVE